MSWVCRSGWSGHNSHPQEDMDVCLLFPCCNNLGGTIVDVTGVIKALYPTAVPASLTNPPGISWHSRGGYAWYRQKSSIRYQLSQKKGVNNGYRGTRAPQYICQSATAEGTKCPDGASIHAFLCLVERHPFVLTLPCPPTESQNVDRDWTATSQTRIRLNAEFFPDEENNPGRIPVAGTRKAAGRSVVSSSFSGLEEASHSVLPQPTLWHIWLMCFTLGLLDLVPKKLPEQTKQHSQSTRGQISCPPLYATLILNCRFTLFLSRLRTCLCPSIIFTKCIFFFCDLKQKTWVTGWIVEDTWL